MAEASINLPVLPPICENKIPDRYYRVINHISPKESIMWIFIGPISDTLQPIIDALQKGSVPNSIQTDSLVNHFGSQYMSILALDGSSGSSKVIYINDLIEVDDDISAIKNKIAVYGKIMPDWQYLYVYVPVEETKSVAEVGLGFTFILKKENKKSEDILIEYPKDPFADISLTHSSLNAFIDQHTGNKSHGYQKNDTSATLITEYEAIKNEIHLVTFCNFVKYVSQDNIKSKYVGISLNKLKYGYLTKYWPNFVINTETSKMNEIFNLCSTKTEGPELPSEYKSLVEKVDKDAYIISLIKHPPPDIGNAEVKFDPCGILEIVIHINYNANLPEFIDLMKIFDRFKLSKKVPFVKYKGDKAKEPRHKLYGPIIKENSMDVVQDWISNIQKRKKDDVFEYKVSGKGLSFKHLLYQNVDEKTGQIENKYATVNFYKDGKIEFKCFWEEYRSANLSNVREALSSLIEMVNEVNKIEYHLPQIDRKMRIPVPELSFVDDKDSNTQIAFINTVTRFNFNDLINFDKLNEFTSCFNTYVSIIKKNISLEYDAALGKKIFKAVMSNSMQLRYKRINNYMQLSVVEKFIHDIVKQTEGIDKIVIIKLLAERFGIVQEVAEKIYAAYMANQSQSAGNNEEKEKFNNLDYVLGKKISKQPGIDIKIQGQEADKYKIFILGAKNIFQLSLIHQFLGSLLRLFKKSTAVYNNPTFKSYVQKGLCQLPDDLIDVGINESMEAYHSLEKQKKNSKIAGVLDLEESDVADMLAALEGDEGPTIEDIDAQLQPEDDIPEEVEGDESEVDEEGEVKAPAKVAPAKKLVFDYTKQISALARLKASDPILFQEGSQNKKPYSKTCQSNVRRQPMVVDSALAKSKMDELKTQMADITAQETKLNKNKPEGYVQKLADLAEEKKRAVYKLDVYTNGVEYRDNYYFCPEAYEYSSERILYKDEIVASDKSAEMKDKTTGNVIYYAEPKNKWPRIGFLEKPHQATGEWCMPCCYKKPQHGFSQCIDNAESEVKTETKSNVRYILSSEKTGIPPSRYGMLPEMLNLIFNHGIKPDNKIMTGFNSYLRRGISIDPSYNIFLNAVADSLGVSPLMDGQALRAKLINNLTLPTFLSLKSGALKLVFQDATNTSDEKAYENFKNFINDKHYINEDLLWDYITTPNILTPKGFNLFIFESTGPKGKIGDNITLKCPVGYEVNDLYSSNKPSLVLFKYHNRYEPIYHVNDNGTLIKATEMFTADNTIIKKLTSMMNQCTPEIDNQAYNNEELLLKKMNLTPIKFEDPFTLKKTADRIHLLLNQYSKMKSYEDYGLTAQIIDNYNKAIYVVTKGKFKIPVKPSSRSSNLPIAKYDAVPPLSYEKSVIILKQLSETTSIPLKPLLVLTDGAGVMVTGILLNNGLTVDVIPMPISELAGAALLTHMTIPTIRQYYHSRNAVDQSISDVLVVKQVDERLHYVNMRQFEDESYQRLRYELSKELQKIEYAKLQQNIRETIASTSMTVNQKRLHLMDILIGPLENIITTVRSKVYDYDTYHMPNVRTACMDKTIDQCTHDPHCESSGGKCKLFLEPTNLIDTSKNNPSRYLSLIVEELLKNHLKRTEILTDQVDNTVNDNVMEHYPNEIIFKGTYKENKKRLEKLYKNEVDYYEKLSKLYDTANPIFYQDSALMGTLLLGKLTETSCHQGFEPLTVYWNQILGHNFRRLNNDKSTNCLFFALTLALNQRDSKINQVYTVQSIRSLIADNVEYLKDEPSNSIQIGRKGWQLLLDHYRYLFKNNLKDVYSETDLKQYMKSDLHQPSLIDLVMISQLFSIKFIIMSRKRSPYNPSGFICLGSTTNASDNYILLYKIDWEDYEIIANTSHSPPKYIFSKEELPTKLYQHWAEVCGPTDLKPTTDEQIPLLLKAPLFKQFDIAPKVEPIENKLPGDENKQPAKIKIGIKAISAKNYFVDPSTQEVLPIQAAKKIPIGVKSEFSQISTTTAKADEKSIEAQKLVDILEKKGITVSEEKKIKIGIKPPVEKIKINIKMPVPIPVFAPKVEPSAPKISVNTQPKKIQVIVKNK